MLWNDQGSRIWIAALLLMLLATACGGHNAVVPDSGTTQQDLQPAADLQSLPFPDPQADAAELERSPAALSVITKLGKSTYKRSPNAMTAADNLELSSTGTEPAWGMYRFDGLKDTDQALELTVIFDSMPDEYFVGMADFASGRWIMISREDLGGLTIPQDDVDIPTGHDFVTANGSVYAAVIHTLAGTAVLEQLELNVDVHDSAPLADFSASIIRGNAALSVDFDAGNSTDLDGVGSIASYEWDWDGDGIYEENLSSPLVQHTYPEPGIYLATLRVTDDNDGLTDTAVREIRVQGWIKGIGSGYEEIGQSFVSSGETVFGVGSLYNTDEASSNCCWCMLDAFGKPLVMHQWNNGKGGASFYGAAAMPDGGIVVTGISGDIANSDNALLVGRISAAGELLWMREWNTGEMEIGYDVIAVDEDSIYVSGITRGFRFDGNDDAIFLKLDGDGNLLWQKRLSGADSTIPTGVDSISGGNLVYSIWVDSYSNTRDAGIAWLDPAGNLTGERVYDFPQHIHQNDLQTDRFGAIYTSGYYEVPGQDTHSFVAKFNGSGGNLWLDIWKHADSSRSGKIYLRYPNVLSSPDVYVAGNVDDNGKYFSMITQFSSSGTLEKAVTWVNGASSSFASIGPGPYGSMLIGGGTGDGSFSSSQVSPVETTAIFSELPGVEVMFDVNADFSDPGGTASELPLIENPQSASFMLAGAYYPEDL
ncbi:PKD domain-containing protein [bacterium]|nr:PKD domain-containing protein [bacterium]